MRGIDSKSITEAVLAYNSPDMDPRSRQLLEGLVVHLHDYIRELRPTHAAWRTAIDFLTRAGAITTEERNEFVLTSDILCVSSLVDMINSASGGTESSVLSPFHIRGAPALSVGGDLIGENSGDKLLVSGRVLDAVGRPIAGAELEIWQTADNGLYSNQDAAQSEFKLRASMRVGADGRYAFTTIKPAPYMVPDDGPVGGLLRAAGRRPWRPSHLHVIATAPGYRSIVTELFPSDDPYLDQDAVFGVRKSLVIEYRPRQDISAVPSDIQARDMLAPLYYDVAFDFVLIEQKTA